MINPYFFRRDAGILPVQPGLDWRAESCTWALPGGPDTAWLSAPAARNPAHNREDLLRCPVELLDEQGLPVWWGYVAAVEQDGVRSSLDGMYNRVRVDYRYSEQSDALHVFADDLASQEIYGQKELFFDLGIIDHAERARSLAQGWLEHACRPEQSWRPGGAGQVRLLLRGWWQTLGWRFRLWDGEGLRSHETQPVDEASIGSSASTARGAQGFYGPLQAPAWTASRIRLSLRKVGSPADSLRVAVQTDSGGVPSGVELEGIDIAAGGLTGNLEWYEYELPLLAAELQPGELYHIVFSRSGAANASNYYRVGLDTPYPVTGALYYLVWNGSSWVQRSPNSIAVHCLWGEAQSGGLIDVYAGRDRGGQFLNGADVPLDTGRWVAVYQQRVHTYRREIQDLLALGSRQGQLAALITPARGLRVFHLPEQDECAALVMPDGGLAGMDGRPLAPHRIPLGGWARRTGLPAAAPALIERVIWKQGKVRIA